MIHFLGSDVYTKNSIYTKLGQDLNEIEFIIGEEKLKELTTINPTLVIKNEKLAISRAFR